MGFLSSFYLFGLFLASLPIIIHLLHRRRLKRVNFSSLFFLRDLKRERFSWLRLREILLLILRTLIIFFLFFALARPYIRTALPLKREKSSVVIIIDDSYSMGYKDRFKIAIKQTEEILKSLSKGSEVALFTTSPQRRDEFLSRDLKGMIEGLDNLGVTYSAEDFKESHRLALSLLLASDMLKRKIFFITDLQKRALSSILSEKREGVDCFVIDVGEKKSENLGVVDIFTTEPLPTSKRPTKIGVRVKNYSGKSFDLRLRLLTEGLREDWTGRIGGFQTKTIQFEKEFMEPKEYAGFVELIADSLLQDNKRFFSFSISSKIPILLLYQESEDIFYIRAALSPSLESPFLIETRRFDELKGMDLGKFRVVGVINPKTLSSSDWLRLKEYSKRYGLFISLLKPDKDWAFKIGEGIEEVSLPGFLSIKDIDYSHPIFSGLKERLELKSSHFFDICKFIPLRAKVLVQLSDGSPFLLEDSLQRVILATTNFTPQTTDFIYKAAFVPFFHRLFLYLSKKNLKTDYRVGDTIEVSISQPHSVEITTPSENFRVLPEVERNKRVIKWDRTELPGVYKIGKDFFTVNVQPEEGNLEKISLSELKRSGIKLLGASGAGAKDLSKISLSLAVIFLILEMVLLL